MEPFETSGDPPKSTLSGAHMRSLHQFFGAFPHIQRFPHLPLHVVRIQDQVRQRFSRNSPLFSTLRRRWPNKMGRSLRSVRSYVQVHGYVRLVCQSAQSFQPAQASRSAQSARPQIRHPLAQVLKSFKGRKKTSISRRCFLWRRKSTIKKTV